MTAREDAQTIHVNQIGYLPDAPKVAVCVGSSANQFALEGPDRPGEARPLSPVMAAPCAGETVRLADFTSLRTPGRWRVVAGDAASPAFDVGEGVYDGLFAALLKMLYLQRCGVALGAAEAGPYAHPACHDAPATVYGTDRRIDVSGGWHDAGDYGRYVVSGAKAAADLLLAARWLGPRSAKGRALLAEARFELDWLVKMQAPSGGAYHKVTCRRFPGFVHPQFERDELVVCPVSNAATGDLAAVLALAAQVFPEGDDPALAEAAPAWLAAAERAWAYLAAHAGDPGFRNPPDVFTGEYGDEHDEDEAFWAAAELARATGKAVYRDAAAALLPRARPGLGWEDVGTYGLWAVLNDPGLPDGDPLRQAAERRLRALAEASLARIGGNPYGIDRSDAFEWGSNMGVANDGVTLLMAAEAFGDRACRDAAFRQLDYLLGANPNGICYVTGFGARSPRHPHHRPSAAAGAPMPGMLVGGPDNGLHDPRAQAELAGAPPAKCYVDHVESYSTNEICVYWNSPLILLLAGLTR